MSRSTPTASLRVNSLFGIHFTASPRFADMLLVTGPVSRNMEIALRLPSHARGPAPGNSQGDRGLGFR